MVPNLAKSCSAHACRLQVGEGFLLGNPDQVSFNPIQAEAAETGVIRCALTASIMRRHNSLNATLLHGFLPLIMSARVAHGRPVKGLHRPCMCSHGPRWSTAQSFGVNAVSCRLYHVPHDGAERVKQRTAMTLNQRAQDAAGLALYVQQQFKQQMTNQHLDDKQLAQTRAAATQHCHMNQNRFVCSALVELYLEGSEEAQDAAWAALLAAEAFCRPNKLAALNELTRRLIDGKHAAKVCFEQTQDCGQSSGLSAAALPLWQCLTPHAFASRSWRQWTR